MKTIKKITSLFVLMMIPFVGAYALTGGDSKQENQDVRTIEITATDQMNFSKTQITAKPGEEIRIVLTTESTLPKAAMSHNFVLMQQGTDLENFVNQSVMAQNNSYIAPELEDKVIAATDLAGGGETVEVTFTVPQEKGDYTYLCSFPGHFLGGMKGTLTVE